MILYHSTPRENAVSILTRGLLADLAQALEYGIFLTDTLPARAECFAVFAVDVSGLEIEEDWTGGTPADNERWFVTYDDIEPARIKLI